ncbi:MAG: YhbY family RNA-binding protein [Opitutaceae bacterium]|nr:YhbY family RNA-binding protein [Opitutaceae bacterium]
MYEFPLTGAQKRHLRGLGQQLSATLHLGKDGLTANFMAEMQNGLRAQELVKVRLHGLDRDACDMACAQLADEGRCVWIGRVGHTALFYRQQPDPALRQIELP